MFFFARFETLPDVALAYIVEWAPHLDGPWSSSWEGLHRIPATEAESVTVPVPMFFRTKRPSVSLPEINDLLVRHSLCPYIPLGTTRRSSLRRGALRRARNGGGRGT